MDVNKNNLLHIATKYDNTKALEYFLENTSLDLMDRNKKGETSLSIAQEKKLEKTMNVLMEY